MIYFLQNGDAVKIKNALTERSASFSELLDADHELILARGDSKRSLEPTRNAARRAGLSEESIRRWYPSTE